jgi:hypothetical protein
MIVLKLPVNFYFHGNIFTTRLVCIQLAGVSRDFNQYFNEYFDEIVFKLRSTVCLLINFLMTIRKAKIFPQ